MLWNEGLDNASTRAAIVRVGLTRPDQSHHALPVGDAPLENVRLMRRVLDHIAALMFSNYIHRAGFCDTGHPRPQSAQTLQHMRRSTNRLSTPRLLRAACSGSMP